MAKLIVHGDDFGLSSRITDGILEAHRRGILTSTSISPCGSDFVRAAELARSEATLDVGVHLTLVEEKSLLREQDVSTLLGIDGLFHRDAATFVRRYLASRIDLSEVQAELEAQIQRVFDHGLRASHIDSHQHLHFLPSILNMVVRLGERYRIPAIRLPRRMLEVSPHNLLSGVRLAQLWVLGRLARRATDVVDVRSDGLTGFLCGGHLDERRLAGILRRLPLRGTFELMCHPGLEDLDSPYLHWGYEWKRELDALTSPRIKDLLESRRIDLISYSDLAAKP